MRRSRNVLTVGLGIALLAAITAAPALALPPPITGSTITSPSDGTELFYNGDSGSGSVTVRGTVAGADTGTRGDLRCYSAADTASTALLTGINVSSGSFAADVSLAAVAGQACRLRLVPAGQQPTGTDAAAFAGPAIVVNTRFSHSASGNLYGYDIVSGPLQWSYEFESLGECPVYRSFETIAGTLGAFELFAGNACLPEVSGDAPSLHSRSALQVDGLNAYPPAAIAPPPHQSSPNLTGLAGFEPLAYNPVFNGNHDQVTINEADTPTICDPPGTFPPTPSTCPSLHDSGIRVQQTTHLVAGGQVVRLAQQFTNVDNRPHTIDLLFGQSVIAPAPGELPGFEFPAQSSFAAHAQPDSFSQFNPGASSIIVVGDAAAAPSAANPIGAITFATPPTSADFISASGGQTATFTMHYTARLAAGASVLYQWSFSQATSVLNLAALEQAERDRFAQPQITIARPHNHAVTHKARVTVSGVASDAVGIKSVTVNGKPALVQNGAWTVALTIKPGKHVITATATNLAGNSQHASATITYRPLSCVVPKLRGDKLPAARRALRHHNCRTGTVVRVHSRHVKRGRVLKTEPGAGSKRKASAEVRVYVSRGR